MPSDDISSYFRRLALGSDTQRRLKLKPLGRAVFRTADIEDGWVHQIPPERLADDEDVVCFFEQDILNEMTVGTKVTAQICELSSGFRFVKTLENVQPSFYTFLPQHLIKDYKPPRINDRPPRSVHDTAAAAPEHEAAEEQAGEQPGEE
ncbi:hypothetical protein PWT90_10633 [Aphanocladium album]|nr:hypothetical protein PWT90_10633 [Aphanocladium album]